MGNPPRHDLEASFRRELRKRLDQANEAVRKVRADMGGIHSMVEKIQQLLADGWTLTEVKPLRLNADSGALTPITGEPVWLMAEPGIAEQVVGLYAHQIVLAKSPEKVGTLKLSLSTGIDYVPVYERGGKGFTQYEACVNALAFLTATK